jgi:hypothetical protein
MGKVIKDYMKQQLIKFGQMFGIVMLYYWRQNYIPILKSKQKMRFWFDFNGAIVHFTHHNFLPNNVNNHIQDTNEIKARWQ